MAYLFKKDKFRQSLRLGFAGAWRHTHPAVSCQLASIQATCPLLTDHFIMSNEPGLLDDLNSDEFRAFKCADARLDSVLSTLDIAIPGGFSQGLLERQFLSRLKLAYKDLYGIQNPEVYMNCKINSFANIRFKKRYYSDIISTSANQGLNELTLSSLGITKHQYIIPETSFITTVPSSGFFDV
jgi:hypothetical protein